MRTRKPVSSISYNTPAFLALKLEELQTAGKISYWFFIQHEPEEDEKKRHIHLYLMPSKMIQTDDLCRELQEFDPSHPTKPLKTLSFRTSVFDDWYLYCLHDEAYLLRKGQKRDHHYSRDEFCVSDEDEFERCISEIDFVADTGMKMLVNALREGYNFDDLVRFGYVPVHQFIPYQRAWEFLVGSPSLYRAGRPTHTPIEDSGENLTD